MQSFKEQIIENVTAIIKKAVPLSEVRVYGSHATKLCLPWSDIDLVIITPNRHGENMYTQKSALFSISQELKNEMASKWVRDVNYVDNATVPVIKFHCIVKDLLKINLPYNQTEFEKRVLE